MMVQTGSVEKQHLKSLSVSKKTNKKAPNLFVSRNQTPEQLLSLKN